MRKLDLVNELHALGCLVFSEFHKLCTCGTSGGEVLLLFARPTQRERATKTCAMVYAPSEHFGVGTS